MCIRVIQRKETPLEALRGTLRRDTEHEHTENRAMTTTPGEHNQPALFPYAQLRTRRSSVKFTRYAEDVLPLSVAEMDFELAGPVSDAIIDRVRDSDFGYIDSPGPLAPAFARFAATRWGWDLDPDRVRVTTDVSVGLVETLRYGIPLGGRVVVTPPVYTPFYEVIEEALARVVEVPLARTEGQWSIDLDALETAFAAGADAFLLCNPHNPIGLVHSRATLEKVAQLASEFNVLVVSDEVHAPLTHPGNEFTPFASIAAGFGARAVCITSASKGWNLAGAKCALLVAGDSLALDVLNRFPEEVTCRTSILGLHANVAAFSSIDWLDAAIARIVKNDSFLANLLAERLPAVEYHRPQASYLSWIDFRPLGLGDDPAASILEHAKVALNAGHLYGESGRGFARLNIACDPGLINEAVSRISAFVRQ